MNFSSIKYLVKEGFKNIWNNRIMSIASIGVMMSCLLLTGAAMLASININQLLREVESQNSIRVFLKMDVSTLQAVNVGQEIKKIPNVNECKFVSKDETVKQYSKLLGDGPLSEGLEGPDNPFPNVYNISLFDLSIYDETINEIKNIDFVDSVTDISEIAYKLTKLNHIVSIAGVVLIIVLGAVSVFILSNTIRITMYSRRLEISIMKSVGATDWFIRIPFLVESIVIGVVAALLSSFLLKIAYEKVIEFISHMDVLRQIQFNSMSGIIVVSFVFFGILFGVIGAMITIRKYLKRDGGSLVAM